MERYYLNVSGIYVSVDNDFFYEVVDRISKDHTIKKWEIDRDYAKHIVFDAVLEGIISYEPKEIGFIAVDK